MEGIKGYRKAAFARFKNVFWERPLLLPSLLLVVFMNIFALIPQKELYSGRVKAAGVVRSISYKLDGSFEAVIKTEKFGRLLYKGDIKDQENLLHAGDRIDFTGMITVPDKPGNPGEFDYAGYLRRRGIKGLLKADGIKLYKKHSGIMDISAFITDACFKIRQKALITFDEEDRPLAAAVFLGDSSLVGEDVTRAFRLSDCSHILAVSGTHFSGFLYILSEIIRRRHIKREYSASVYIAFCIFVGSITCWSESVTRAAVISIACFLSRDFLSGLSLAVIMLAVKDPYSLLSTGFGMSFMSFLSVRLFGGKIERILLKTGIHPVIITPLSLLLASNLGMMPFWGRTTMYFSVLHSAVQIAASALATAGCVFFIPSVMTGLPFAASYTLKLLQKLINFCSENAFTGASSSGLSRFFIYSLFVMILLLLIPPGIIKKRLIKPAAVILAVSVGFAAADYIAAPDLRIVFIDVGQGDSCLIIYRSNTILIDGGIESEGRYTVSQVLDYYGISKVDIAIASHMDEDHKGGLDYLDSAGRIDRFLTCYDLKSGDKIILGDLVFYCLWPSFVTDGGNEDSVVLKLQYKDTSFLFTGDIGFQTERTLILKGADIDADILKVGHHGSAYSTSSEFIEAVSPDTSVISVGKFNSYGHPSPDTIQRLSDYGCSIRMTACEGAVIYEFR